LKSWKTSLQPGQPDETPGGTEERDSSREFVLAEHWYVSTGLEDLLGVPDAKVTIEMMDRGMISNRRLRS
jgi:hypothetical protein